MYALLAITSSDAATNKPRELCGVRVYFRGKESFRGDFLSPSISEMKADSWAFCLTVGKLIWAEKFN